MSESALLRRTFAEGVAQLAFVAKREAARLAEKGALDAADARVSREIADVLGTLQRSGALDTAVYELVLLEARARVAAHQALESDGIANCGDWRGASYVDKEDE